MNKKIKSNTNMKRNEIAVFSLDISNSLSINKQTNKNQFLQIRTQIYKLKFNQIKEKK